MGIDIQGLSFRYEDGAQVLEDIFLRLNPGEVVGLLGHNGSGKSTLVKHLNGLLLPTCGVVKINDIPTTENSVAQLSAKVGLLFQNPDDQICKGTVWEEVTFGPGNLGYSEERIQYLASEFLASFELTLSKDCNPYDLGDSERKRLAIASVLAMDTEIVVLDEPTAGLDPREIFMLEVAVRKLESDGKIVVIISHDMDFIAENTSRAVCLKNGSKQFDGSTIALFNNLESLQECGLLPPQVVQLSSHFKLNLSTFTPQGFLDKLLK